ncbi:MAG: hydroxylamine reductase [Firmicutes bacterium]|nr:hydroxylamine reductase [Bacillota bacterium]
MEQKMFCYQCEQTAGGKGCCGKAGVCGKTAVTAEIQDKISGALIGLARTARSIEKETEVYDIITKGLFTTVTNVNFDDEDLNKLIGEIEAKAVILSSCGCGGKAEPYAPYDITAIWADNEDIRALKSMLLFGLRGMAAYAYHAAQLDRKIDELAVYFCKGLAALAEEHTLEEWIALNMELGKYNLLTMELLDTANRDTYGIPVPQTIDLTIEPGPFIVITGHDLNDLEELLLQTENRGINVYTHGEMLPAHSYPKLKKFSHLKGNFGTAWHNQKEEFDGIPAPILYTTNCLTPQKPSYSDRIFTTGPVSWPGVPHIDEKKDFSAVIEKAIELGGYSEPQKRTGINGGSSLTVGFGKETVLAHAGDVVSAVKNGEIKHFFLVGGCDGIRKTRSYYTEFVEKTPKDSIILTLGCGKYRFNDIDLGTVAGLPRLMDMGQCNDAFSAIQVAVALSQAFDCDVNDLPLTLVLSWYEQKAVAILLTLLHLGIKNIYLGPTLPALLSPNVTKFLVDTFNIHPTSTPDEDLKAILG